MTVTQAARRLGVKPPTLYAYVSRGVLASVRAPDGRRSLFESEAIEQLARRGRPRRASRGAALDIVIETAITEIDERGVRFRGHRLDDLAAGHTFEEVATLLWTGRLGPTDAWPTIELSAGEGGVLDQYLAAVIAAGARDPDRRDRRPDAITRVGPRVATALLASLPVLGDGRTPRLHLPDRTPIRGTLAGRLWTRLTPARPTPAAVATLNSALVLLADHELAASTLAVRVAASTRADPYAAVVAGLAVVSGPLHGSASRHVRKLIRRAESTSGDAAVLEATSASASTSISTSTSASAPVPGFGHFLYPNGDPRAKLLLAAARDAWPSNKRWLPIDGTIAAARRRTDAAPNIDFVLAAIGHLTGMDDDAGERIFALARTAGWLAHAFEEYGERPLRFRPRAVVRDV